jgi:hypothetical protein
MEVTRKDTRIVAGFALLLAGACGGSPGAGSEGCPLGIGLGAPPCACTSWTPYVGPGPSLCSGCAEIVPDLSTVPARATIHVGQKVMVGSSIYGEQPEGCNQGGWNSRPTWTASNPAVLRLVETEPAGFSTATFLATAPGVSTALAEDLVAPGGVVQRVGLSACTQTVTTGLTNRCVGRTPLDIHVLP